VEFEVEGLTVTHALNLQLAAERPQDGLVLHSCRSEDSRKAGSLESLISRHQVFGPQKAEEYTPPLFPFPLSLFASPLLPPPPPLLKSALGMSRHRVVGFEGRTTPLPPFPSLPFPVLLLH